MNPMTSRPVGALTGDIRLPGDKSISHRALMIAASAVGRSQISGLLEADDVLATAAALRGFGADIRRDEGNDGPIWQVHGLGVGGFAEPGTVLDMENSGTGTRLLMGLAAGHGFTTFFRGDGSLSARPMERIMAPLRRMGAEFLSHSGGRLPLAVTGSTTPIPIVETPPIASAQVKSAILLAGLSAPGVTTVIEPRPTRDHTERMLSLFGANISIEQTDQGTAVSLRGQPELSAAGVQIPGDISSAAFPLVAALLVPGSEVTVRGIGVNTARAGLIECLKEMGADITVMPLNTGASGGEPVADITVRSGPLRAIEVPPERAPSMIDEYPALAMAAACADGETHFLGVDELRVKESDRLHAIAEGLAACGVNAREGEDSLAIEGRGDLPPGGAMVETKFDHRIAMAFLVLGAAAKNPVTVDDGSPIATSFPEFQDLMTGLGGDIHPEEPPA